MKKSVDILIISGASVTASPWFTWADVLVELLKPSKIINLSARGTGNYWICLSLINSILDLSSDKNILCAPMFTNIDKFDMFLPATKTPGYLSQKHRPIDLYGHPTTQSSFWCTGSHWPQDKELYLEHFFDPTISAINNMISFNNLQTVCDQKGTHLMPLFDSYIWNILEKDLNAYPGGAKLPDRKFLDDPMVNKFSRILDKKFLEFVPLINWAIENDLPFYNDINKMHPPSDVHLKWMIENVLPRLQENFHCDEIGDRFLSMVDSLSKEWRTS